MVTVMPYERYLHYRNGRLVDVVEPGRHRFWGTGHRLIRVDLRSSLLPINLQEIPSADGIVLKAGAVVRLRVVDPVAFHERTNEPYDLVYDAAKVALRELVAAVTHESAAAGIRVELVPPGLMEAATSVGLEVESFDVRDVVLPSEIRRSAERLVTARQQSQIALEAARSEVAVLRAMANTAKILEDNPALAAIRLAESAGQHGGTVVVKTSRPQRS